MRFASVCDGRRPVHLVKRAVACFLRTRLHTEIDSVTTLDGNRRDCSGIRTAVALCNSLVPKLIATLLDSNSYAVCLLVFVSVIVTSRSDKAHLPCHADSSILWCLPYTHNVLHRRVLDGFRLLVLTDLHDRSVNLATIDDRAWCVGTAQCKRRHGIA